LSAQRDAEAIRTRRLQASVNLIRALGGGWNRSEMNPPASALVEAGHSP
jgi:outer membrane protein, multidrug efflux system